MVEAATSTPTTTAAASNGQQVSEQAEFDSLDGLDFSIPPNASGAVVGDEEPSEEGTDFSNEESSESQEEARFSWAEVSITVGKSDWRRHRLVTMYLFAWCHRAERLYFSPRRLGVLRWWLEQGAQEFRIVPPEPPRWVLENILAEAKKADQAAAVLEIKTIALADLAAQAPAQKMLIDGLLPQGQLSIVAGQEKVGKTWFGFSLAVAGETGQPLFGRFAVPNRFRTLYLLQEGGLSEAWQRLRIICESQGVDPRKIRDVLVGDQVPRLATTAGMTQLRQIVLAGGLRGGLLVLDPASYAFGGANTGIVATMAPLFADLIQLCGEEGVTPLLVHHTSRGARRRRGRLAPADLADMTGAGYAEFCRSWAVLSWAKPFDHRNGVTHLWMNCGGSDGHAGQWQLTVNHGTPAARRWAVVCEPATEPVSGQGGHSGHQRGQKRPSRLRLDCRKILETLRSLPQEGETASAIRKAAGNIPIPRFRAAIKALVRHSKIVPCALQKGSRTHAGYRLAAKEKAI